ncbi:hypothetical protein WMY93_002987 [Mugilogobius chulae]|uniref:(S)-2-hydroxy-acid oxidase n=1 Tax=Mugilogobius chulae TaxID=88201 RepID=A0AAW0Q150_9GOBI
MAMVCLTDFEEYAREHLPKATWDYYAAGADDCCTRDDNILAYKSDPRTTVQGTEISFPVGIAPTAFHCLAWPEGEVATARATECLNTCYITSTYSTCSVEEIVAAAPNGYRWFQLYVYRDRKLSEHIVRRVEGLGYKALVLTVDVPYTGKRRNDIRNQFKLPPHLKVKNFDGIFLQETAGPEEYGIPANTLDPSISWKDVYWLQSITHLPIIIKGILTKEDAELAVEHGVQGIIVSNHGGRQLDGGPASIDALTEIVDTVQGKIEVYLDGGIRTGSDVLKALALGAKCVFIGRPAIWGLAYKGEDGVREVLQILNDEFRLSMALSGCRNVSEINRNLIQCSKLFGLSVRLESSLGSGLLGRLSLRRSYRRNSSPQPREANEAGANGEDGGGGGLRGRLSRMGSRHRDNPRAQAQAERERPAVPPQQPVQQDVRPPNPAPAPTPLPPPLSSLPKRPDKSTKPKLPPRPLSKVFISKEHESDVLQGLDSFRASDVLCDVVLVPGDSNEKFPVHRVIMASSSDYFKAMFTGGMREQEMAEIKLHGVTKLGLKSIIDFIYTSKLLCSEVTIENCVEVERIATDLNLEDVQANIGEFVSQNLVSLMESGLHLQLSAATMAKALSSNSLKGFSEMELYQIAKEWLDHDPPNRHSSVYTLMRHIRFPLMSPSDLIHISQAEDDDGDSLMRTDAACVNLLLEASNYQMMPYMQPALQTERTQIRSDSTHILALGGVMRQQLVVSRELRLYDEKTEHWRALKPMEAPRYQHGVALLGGFLFIVGGQSTYDTKEKRTFFHLSALKGKLYAVGGRNAFGEIDTVECYNLKKNEWTFVTNMMEPHYGHAGTVHGDLMYISGGITRDTFQKELWSYDPVSDVWSRRADMVDLRGLHCMCTVGDRLYVMGGNHFRGCSDYDDVLSCEYYSPATDQWTVVAPMPRGQSDVYVVGGYSWNSRCMVDIVQRYDPEKDVWDRVFNVLEPLGGIRACTMTVHCLRGLWTRWRFKRVHCTLHAPDGELWALRSYVL